MHDLAMMAARAWAEAHVARFATNPKGFGEQVAGVYAAAKGDVKRSAETAGKPVAGETPQSGLPQIMGRAEAERLAGCALGIAQSGDVVLNLIDRQRVVTPCADLSAEVPLAGLPRVELPAAEHPQHSAPR